MILLLVLGVCCSVMTGQADEYEWKYGETHTMRLGWRAEKIVFIPKHRTNAMVLWQRGDAPADESSRLQVIDNHLVIKKLVQQDSGRYDIVDKRERTISTAHIFVTSQSEDLDRMVGEDFNIHFDLEQQDCNIQFYSSRHNDDNKGIEVVRGGSMWVDRDDYPCAGMMFEAPCGILNEAIDESCQGHFIFKDELGNLALSLALNVEEPILDTKYLIIAAVAVALGTVLCCCCVKRCCCGKKSGKKANPEVADTAGVTAVPPPVFYRTLQHGHVPAADSTGPVSLLNYRVEPSYSPTVPLIHNPPAANHPTPRTEVTAPAEPLPAPSDPLYPDSEPRYELKGKIFPSAPPLSAEAVFCNVYTSDKLN